MKNLVPSAGITTKVNFRFVGLSLLLAAFSAAGHTGAPPQSAINQAQTLSLVGQLVLPATDPAAETAADAKLSKGGPFKFAVPRKVQASPATDGTWESVAGGRLWRLRAVSTGATDLNFGFTRFWLPEGATLHVISESQPYYQGPYTASDNQDHRQLWTPVVPGEAAVIELFVPSGAAQEPELVLSQVGTGYRDLFHLAKGTSIPKAESCEIDVVCPQGAAWSNEVRSVCRIQISGTAFCTATLLMDTTGDFRPFLLTANHCGLTPSTAPTVVAYWNDQCPTCGAHGVCSPPPLGQNQTGATFRAAKSDVDVALIELNALPSPSYNVYFAGWDRSGTPPSGAVGIHHPNADGKCISFSSNPLGTVDSCIGTGGSSTHWQVTWSQGVTEAGSSGSAIFDPTSHRALGTLSGGGSDCATPTDPDCYGKFSVAWDLGNSSSTRLKDWLDPSNTGATSVAGANAILTPLILPVSSSLTAEACLPVNGVIDPGETVTVNFTLKNTGTQPTTNLVATMQTSGGVSSPSAPQAYGVLTTNGANVTKSFTFTANGTCGGSISPVLKLQDGTRDLGSAIFTLGLGKGISAFSQNFDAVTPPALPSGWTSPSGYWTTVTGRRDTVPNSMFTADTGTANEDPSNVTDRQLISPAISITNQNSQITFRHYFDTEDGFDGGILEISVANGPYTDIIAAGGSFVTGGYNGSISPFYLSVLAGQDAWTGFSSGFQTVVVNLPPTVADQSVRFRWRFGTDDSNPGVGWYVDTVSIIDGYSCCVGAAAPPTLGSLAFSSASGFRFTVTGTAGYPYAVESSTDFVNWARVVTNNSPFTYTNKNVDSTVKQYYRAVFQP